MAAVSLSVRAERMTMQAFRQAQLEAIREARDELKAPVSFEWAHPCIGWIAGSTGAGRFTGSARHARSFR